MKLGWLGLQSLAEINLVALSLLGEGIEVHRGLKVHPSSAETCSAVGADLNKLLNKVKSLLMNP